MKYIIPLIILMLATACQQAEEPKEPDEPLEPDLPKETCNDGKQNQGETGKDCGGPCSACPSCVDDIQNQGEIGIDCGGPCPACPSCDDNIKNQGEEDVDCGGPCKKCDVEYAVSPEEATDVRDKIKPSDKAKFLTNAYPAGLSKGQSHTFVLGVNNIFQDDSTFRIEHEFVEAEDDRTNRIEADSITMMEWLSNNEYQDFILSQYEQQVLPVGITVGKEIAPGVNTQPGFYYFQTTVKHQKTKLTVDEYIVLEFSIRVK